jgi:hypothetical protein
MRKYRIGSLALLMLVAPCMLSAYTLKEEWSKSFSVDAPAALELMNVNGGIDVTAWDRDEIFVSARIRIKAPSKTEANDLFEKLEFEVDASADRVRIEADTPKIRQVGFHLGERTSISIDYDVKVPRQTSLKLNTTNGGIEARGARGTFDLQTVNGHVGLLSAGGEGILKTVNGGITCHLDEFPSGGELRLRTTNGSVELRLPEGAGGGLEAKTMNGSVRVDFTLDGETTIKRRSVRGRLGEGGGSITLRTTNGSISVGRR